MVPCQARARRSFLARAWGLGSSWPGICLYKGLTALLVSRDYQTLSSVSGRCIRPDVSIAATGFRENSAAGKDFGSPGDAAFSHYSDPDQWQTGSAVSPFHSLSHWASNLGCVLESPVEL